MADRRSEQKKGSGDSRQLPRIYKVETSANVLYKPLGQILLDGGDISGEDLDEALRAHWRRGIRLGDIIRELGLVGEKELDEALKKCQTASRDERTPDSKRKAQANAL